MWCRCTISTTLRETLWLEGASRALLGAPIDVDGFNINNKIIKYYQ